MLTKKAKAAADTIREEIGALIKQGETVAKFYEQTDRHYLTARRLWHCWQWFNSYESTHDQPEEATKAKEAHDTNPREWVQTVDKLAEEMEAARVVCYVARVNFQNFADYIARKVAEIVRPYWRDFFACGGFKDLGGYLSPYYEKKDQNTAHAFRLVFSVYSENIRAAGVQDSASFIRLTVAAYVGAPVGVSGKVEGVKMGEDVADIPQEITTPHRLQVNEYKRIIKRLEAINSQARQTLDKLATEARALVRGSGLYGFAEFLAGYSLTISK